MSDEYNAADPQAAEAMQEKLRRDRETELNDIRFMLKTPAGQRFFRRVFAQFGLFRNAMTGNSNTFFRLGEQNVAQWLLNEITLTATSDELAAIMFNPEERNKANG